MTNEYEPSLELLRRQMSMAYRLVMVMTEAVRGHDNLNQALDTCELICGAEQWSIRQWQQCAAHLALLIAEQLAGQLGCDEAAEYMSRQVALVLDPSRFRAALEP